MAIVLVLASVIVIASFLRNRTGSEAPFASGPIEPAQAESPPATAATRPRPGQMTGPQDIPDIEAARERATEAAHVQKRAFASRFSAESVDARWATAKEAVVLAASTSDQIDQLQAHPRNLDIRCKTTMCRIRADFPSRSTAEDWLTLFSLGLGSEMPEVSFEYVVNPDGSTRVTVYGLARG